jgi:hypothetical protein
MQRLTKLTDITYIDYSDIVNMIAILYIRHMPKQAILTTKKLIALDPAMVEEIENFRFGNRIKTEAEAIRQLLDIGLKASRKKTK